MIIKKKFVSNKIQYVVRIKNHSHESWPKNQKKKNCKTCSENVMWPCTKPACRLLLLNVTVSYCN